MMNKEKLKKLENWKELSKGYYRFVISPGFCYEIIINMHNETADILESRARLYATMTYQGDIDIMFTRELITDDTLLACLEDCVSDYESNVTED